MAYPRVAEVPDYTRSGAQFIPEIWSGKILVKFYDATCLSEISNTDYEGEIKKFGDTVLIRTVAPITIRKYVVGQALTRERPTSIPTSLSIDQGYYWDVELDDVMDVQSDIDLLDKWTEEAGQQMKITIETDCFVTMAAGAHAKNQGLTAGVKSSSYSLGASGSPETVDKANVLDYIVDCGSVLDEQNVPETGRWILIPIWMAGLIKKSDLKDASLTGDNTSILRNGRLGQIDRFTLYSSNLLPTAVDGVTCYKSMFGHRTGPSFASQITETEKLRAQDAFADVVRGLNILGFKVLKTESVGILYCHK